MRTILLIILMCAFAPHVFSQKKTTSDIDSIVAAIDTTSGFLCFKYSDSVQKINQSTIWEIHFLYNKRKSPDTLKIIRAMRDTIASYNPMETIYYYVNGKAIKKVVLRSTPERKVAETRIYFLNSKEVVEGPEAPNFKGLTHTQDAEHMLGVYERLSKDESFKDSIGCK